MANLKRLAVGGIFFLGVFWSVWAQAEARPLSLAELEETSPEDKSLFKSRRRGNQKK